MLLSDEKSLRSSKSLGKLSRPHELSGTESKDQVFILL